MQDLTRYARLDKKQMMSRLSRYCLKISRKRPKIFIIENNFYNAEAIAAITAIAASGGSVFARTC